jgi:endoribonuclease Dicer
MSYMDDMACLAQVFAAEGPSHTPQSNAPGHNPAPAKTISSQVSNMEALQIAPALLTRTADEVIADLKRGHARPPRKERKAEEVLEQAKGTGHTNNNVREEKVEGEGDDAMEDSDAEDVLVEQPRIQKAPERQRVNKANFNSYFDKFARQKAKSQTIVEGSHLEKLSVKALVRQAESQRIIASPRDYQQELFEKAKERNIIAVMDTGKELSARQ